MILFFLCGVDFFLEGYAGYSEVTGCGGAVAVVERECELHVGVVE